jgi:uncharacterized protein YbgA (DUF1722 family)
MLDTLFKESLKLAEQLRPKYPQSLGDKTDKWEDIVKKFVSNIPEIYSVIYSNVSGTKRNIKEQDIMDYTPGYRLIHISELPEEKKNLDRVLNHKGYAEGELVLPLLSNYSNDFICYHLSSKGEEHICALMHDEGDLVLMNESPIKFLETVCEFYKQTVYFLDSDGYLDYDIDKEGLVGSNLNPGVKYWL